MKLLKYIVLLTLYSSAILYSTNECFDIIEIENNIYLRLMVNSSKIILILNSIFVLLYILISEL